MPRCPRVCPGETCFYVPTQAVARLPLLQNLEDYEPVERVLIEAYATFPLPILYCCFVANHWNFAVRPLNDNQLSEFFCWLTHTHVMRWHAHDHTEGAGYLYQGRFRAFPTEEDAPLYAARRYIEQNPFRSLF